eukprot:9480127-Pyramimonas_sp.AAC.1
MDVRAMARWAFPPPPSCRTGRKPELCARACCPALIPSLPPRPPPPHLSFSLRLPAEPPVQWSPMRCRGPGTRERHR